MNENTKKRLMLVFGTRPEAIKMCPVALELQQHSDKIDTMVAVTGQHREMLDAVLKAFEVHPDYDLAIMRPGQDLYDITSRVLLGLREVFQEVRPDVVLVHGDTTTSMAAALAAFYSQIPVGHVEAGLRTGNIYSPWPEEMNRHIISKIAKYNFAPTPRSKENLLRENTAAESIWVTGNTVIDALNSVEKRIASDEVLRKQLVKQLQDAGYTPSSRRKVLITGHRRENFGEGFLNICRAIKTLANSYEAVDFIYPAHPNPKVRSAIDTIFSPGDKAASNVYFIEPLDYLPFVYLMSTSDIILTDSGGIQEEAPSFGKPVLVMRDTTERPEAVEAGTVKLVGTSYEKIVHEVSRLLDDRSAYEIMAKATNPYGDGHASERIAAALLKDLAL